MAAWFGGTREGAPDVGIWMSRRDQRHVVRRRSRSPTASQPDGTRHPCWNPVLFQPTPGPLHAVLQGRARARSAGGGWCGRRATAAGPGARRGDCPTASSARSRTSRCGSPTARCSVRRSTETPEQPSSGACTSSAAPTAARRGRWSGRRPASGTPIDAIQPSILVHHGRPAAGGRPHALAARLRDVVGRRRQDLDAGRR